MSSPPMSIQRRHTPVAVDGRGTPAPPGGCIGGIEWILGLRFKGAFLLFTPCVPKHWPHFEVVFRYGSTRYEIVVEHPQGVCLGIDPMASRMAYPNPRSPSG